MEATNQVARRASEEIEAFLRSKPETIEVINVEEDRYFQKKDIDLLWIYKYRGAVFMKRVEIKADRYSRTGNYFIETVSNLQKNTKGCFLYTEADLIFYYFVDVKELHVLPMPFTREWFLNNQERFVEKELSTFVEKKGVCYRTKGKLVPKSVLRKEVKGIKVISLFKFLNEKRAG